MTTESNDHPEPTSCCGFQSWKKIKTLPRIIDEYQQCKIWYERIKKQHWKLGMCCSGIEILVFHLVNLLVTFYSADVVSPFACWMITKARILDEFVCHQLEFVENQLKSMDTEWIYKPNGLIERVYLTTCLTIRLVFMFPRIWYRFMITSVDVAMTEGSEDLELLKNIVSPPKLRRSKRVRSKRGRKTASSPGKKRKHEEMDKTLPQYFYVHEYSQESDPDFLPDSDGNDTEITSASDNSHDEEDEHSGEEELEIVDDIVEVDIDSQPDEEIQRAGPSKFVSDEAGIENPEVIAA